VHGGSAARPKKQTKYPTMKSPSRTPGRPGAAIRRRNAQPSGCPNQNAKVHGDRERAPDEINRNRIETKPPRRINITNIGIDQNSKIE
jgi:hypothetical protein